MSDTVQIALIGGLAPIVTSLVVLLSGYVTRNQIAHLQQTVDGAMSRELATTRDAGNLQGQKDERARSDLKGSQSG